MKPQAIVPGLYGLDFGGVNAFLLAEEQELALIDCGFPGSAGKVLGAIRAIGRQPQELRRIVLTHCHPDHAGGLAELKAATGAVALAHPLDAALIRVGQGMRSLQAAPGLLNKLLFNLAIRPVDPQIPPAAIDEEIAEGAYLPIGGGMYAIHTPGHCAGQIALLWQKHGGVLFAGDAAVHFLGLTEAIAYEDQAAGRRSLRKLAAFNFAVACFGHGRPLKCSADRAFRKLAYRWR